jgi:hypothetical protein
MMIARVVVAVVVLGLVSGCGLAIVRGPANQVMSQASEIHTAAGHHCTSDGSAIHCDEGDPKRNPLLLTASGETMMGIATYADTKSTFGHTCAEMAPAVAASRKPDLFAVDCAITKDGIDRLLLLAPLPIPEGGMADSSFEAGIDAFMKDANAYIENLKNATR